jgi:hypothetical protein
VFATAAVDTQPPSVTSVTPVSGATGVPVASLPVATFSEPVNPSSIAMTVSTGTGSVSGTVSYDATTRTATFTPSAALNMGTAYTVSVSASDTSGNAMAAPYQWSFTTVGCPCTLLGNAVPTNASSGAAVAIELGVRFTSDVPAQVTGVRFYKGPGNTGVHTGTLWSATGTALATGTFTNETASGWQTLTFATPVSIQPNTVYVVSYSAPNGNWAWSAHFYDNGWDAPPLHAAAPNGVYTMGAGFPTSTANNTNYYVDVVIG